jgi:quercetin dioxygenase-like cupin family protein
MSIKHVRDVVADIVDSGVNTTIQVLVSSQEGPNFAMRRFVMGIGGGIPKHTNTVEHEQYILQGHARIGIGDQTFEVRAGDVVIIPEGIQHWYQNLEDKNFEFLCIIPNKPDEIKIVEKEC